MLKDFFKKHGWRYIPGTILMIACAFIQTRSPIALGKAVEMAADPSLKLTDVIQIPEPEVPETAVSGSDAVISGSDQ